MSHVTCPVTRTLTIDRPCTSLGVDRFVPHIIDHVLTIHSGLPSHAPSFESSVAPGYSRLRCMTEIGRDGQMHCIAIAHNGSRPQNVLGINNIVYLEFCGIQPHTSEFRAKWITWLQGGSLQYFSTNAKLRGSERAVCTPGLTLADALKNMMARPASMFGELSHCKTVGVAWSRPHFSCHFVWYVAATRGCCVSSVTYATHVMMWQTASTTRPQIWGSCAPTGTLGTHIHLELTVWQTPSHGTDSTNRNWTFHNSPLWWDPYLVGAWAPT